MTLEFPYIGKCIEKGTIIEWLVKAGDKVKKGEILCEVEAFKAIFEFLSPMDGIVKKINFAKGAEIKVGDLLVE